MLLCHVTKGVFYIFRSPQARNVVKYASQTAL